MTKKKDPLAGLAEDLAAPIQLNCTVRNPELALAIRSYLADIPAILRPSVARLVWIAMAHYISLPETEKARAMNNLSFDVPNQGRAQYQGRADKE